MKRIQSILLAIAMLLAAPAFFTSCQEDAPEINYTMNVSVINDFTKVMEAINNGFLKNEEAIRKLTEAIDKMNADQQTKLQAIIDVLNSVNATLETGLQPSRRSSRRRPSRSRQSSVSSKPPSRRCRTTATSSMLWLPPLMR